MDRVQPRPRRLVAGQRPQPPAVRAEDRRLERRARRADVGHLILGVGAVQRILVHPAADRLVLGVDEEVAELRIVGGAVPVHAAAGAGEHERRRRALPLEPQGRVGARVVVADRVPQRAAGRRVLRRGVVRGHHVAGADAHPRQRRRLARDRLGRGVLLARHVAGGRRPLLDAVDRLARHPVQDEHEGRLADLRQGRNPLAAALDLEQAGRRRQVVVPQLVVDVLEVPRQLAGPRVDGDGRVGEQVVAGPVAAVEVRSGAADRQVDQAALLVDGERERPHVVPDAVAPALAAPRVAAEVGLGGEGRKLPQQRAGGVERPRIRVLRLAAAPRLVQVGRDVLLSGAEGAGPEHQDVPVDHRHAGVRDAQLDFPPVAERDVPFAGARVQGDHLAQAGEVDAGAVRAGGRPVGDAAEGRQPRAQLVPPDLRAGLGPQGDHPVPGGEVHDAVDHDRGDLLEELGRARAFDEPVLGVEAVRPDLLQLADVAGVDPVEGRIAGAGQIAVVGRPVRGGAPLLGRRRRGPRRPEREEETDATAHGADPRGHRPTIHRHAASARPPPPPSGTAALR